MIAGAAYAWLTLGLISGLFFVGECLSDRLLQRQRTPSIPGCRKRFFAKHGAHRRLVALIVDTVGWPHRRADRLELGRSRPQQPCCPLALPLRSDHAGHSCDTFDDTTRVPAFLEQPQA